MPLDCLPSRSYDLEVHATIEQIERLFVELTEPERVVVLNRLTRTQPTPPRIADSAWDRLFEFGNRLAAADTGGPSATEDLTAGRR